MNSDLQFQAAIAQQIVWKNAQMQRFAVALVRHALSALDGGVVHFSTDLVPEHERGVGPGIAGSVVELLKNANVIEPVGIQQNGVWFPHRERSRRPGCKSRYLCLHQLKTREGAEEFLRRNRIPAGQQQMQLTTG